MPLTVGTVVVIVVSAAVAAAAAAVVYRKKYCNKLTVLVSYNVRSRSIMEVMEVNTNMILTFWSVIFIFI